MEAQKHAGIGLVRDNVKRNIEEFYEVSPSGIFVPNKKAIQSMVANAIVPDTIPPYIEVDPERIQRGYSLMDELCGLWAVGSTLVFIAGRAGTGKSTLIANVARELNVPLFKIEATRQTREAHLIGYPTIQGDYTVFIPGNVYVAVKAASLLKQPFILHLEEGVELGERLTVLHSLLDASRSLAVKDTAEFFVIPRSISFMVIVTYNPSSFFLGDLSLPEGIKSRAEVRELDPSLSDISDDIIKNIVLSNISEIIKHNIIDESTAISVFKNVLDRIRAVEDRLRSLRISGVVIPSVRDVVKATKSAIANIVYLKMPEDEAVEKAVVEACEKVVNLDNPQADTLSRLRDTLG